MTPVDPRLFVTPDRHGFCVSIGDEQGPLMRLPGSERATREECERLIEPNEQVHPEIRTVLNSLLLKGAMNEPKRIVIGRSDDGHYTATSGGYVGKGANPREAVGDLVFRHPVYAGVIVVWPGGRAVRPEDCDAD